MLKADFHIHTAYSMDCKLSLEAIINRCLETKIDCITIADHGTIEGALKMKELAPFPVIIAEEILTQYGEIMGMFLKEGIPTGLPIEQAISHIKAQGALVSLPHPFDTFRGLRLDRKRLEEMVEQIDIIESYQTNIKDKTINKTTLIKKLEIDHNIHISMGTLNKILTNTYS